MSRSLKSFLLIFGAYLVQVTAMPLLPINDVTPNIMIIVLSVLIVGYGKQHGFVGATISGILLESMLQQLVYFNLLVYPSMVALCMLPFADKTERKMEMERAIQKDAKNLNPLLRTVACITTMCIIYEMASIGYSLLTGMEFSTRIVGNSLTFVIYTTVLGAILMFPLRLFLGLKTYLPRLFKKKKVRVIKDLNPALGKSPIFFPPIETSTLPKENYIHIQDKDPNLYLKVEEGFSRQDVFLEEVDAMARNVNYADNMVETLENEIKIKHTEDDMQQNASENRFSTVGGKPLKTVSLSSVKEKIVSLFKKNAN